MGTVIFSDIHGKADCLLQVLESHPNDSLLCLGDALGMGDNPRTLGLLREREVPCVKGNHEVDLLHHYPLAADELSYIEKWPFEFKRDDALFCHTWIEKAALRFNQIDSILAAQDMFASDDFQIAFVGHSHSPGWWTLEEERPVWKHAAANSALSLGDKRYIVDVGSVGEPKLPQDARYALWEGKTIYWFGL